MFRRTATGRAARRKAISRRKGRVILLTTALVALVAFVSLVESSPVSATISTSPTASADGTSFYLASGMSNVNVTPPVALAGGALDTHTSFCVNPVVKTTTKIVLDGTLVLGSPALQSPTAAFTAADLGLGLKGTGIPTGTQIVSVQSATAVTMSAPATTTATGVKVGIGTTKALTSISDPTLPWTAPGKPKCDKRDLSSAHALLPVNPIVVSPKPVEYGGPIAGTQWISVRQDAHNTNETTPYFYDYDAEFTLPKGCTSATLAGLAYSDNAVGVYLNGHLLANQAVDGGSANFGASGASPLSFGYTSVNPNWFAAANTIDFIVEDTFGGNLTGLDYGVVVTPQCAFVKVCKVGGAGSGVLLGQSFPFTITGPSGVVQSVNVLAGYPPPGGGAGGGYCQLASTPYIPGVQVDVAETPNAAYKVIAIDKDPIYLGGTVDVAAGKVTKLPIKLGINVLTFADVSATKQMGHIEICRTGPTVQFPNPFTVTSGPGGNTSVQVSAPAGACTPPISVEAGPVTVSENAAVASISALPFDAMSSSDLATGTAHVTVTAQPSGTGYALMEPVVTFGDL